MPTTRRAVVVTLLALLTTIPVIATASPPEGGGTKSSKSQKSASSASQPTKQLPKTTNVKWKWRQGGFKSPSEAVPNHQPDAFGGWASVWLSDTASSRTVTEVDVCHGDNANGNPAYGIAHRIVEPNRQGWVCNLPSGKLAEIMDGDYSVHVVHRTLSYGYVPTADLEFVGYDSGLHGQNPKAAGGRRAICRKTHGGKPRVGTVVGGKCRIVGSTGVMLDGRADVYGHPHQQYSIKDHEAPFEVAVM